MAKQNLNIAQRHNVQDHNGKQSNQDIEIISMPICKNNCIWSYCTKITQSALSYFTFGIGENLSIKRNDILHPNHILAGANVLVAIFKILFSIKHAHAHAFIYFHLYINKQYRVEPRGICPHFPTPSTLIRRPNAALLTQGWWKTHD